MSETYMLARFTGSLLLKSLASSALAFSALAVSVILSGGAAKALECTFSAGVITGCNYGPQWPGFAGSPIPAGPAPTGPPSPTWKETNIQFNGITYYYPTDKDLWFLNGPTAGSGKIEWTWEDVNNSGTWLIPPDPHSVDTWTVDVDFNPNLTVQSNFEYVVIIDKGQGGDPHLPWNHWFEDVQLISAITAPTPGGLAGSVTKTIWEAVCTSSIPDGKFDSCVQGDLLGTLTNSGLLSLWKNPALTKGYYDKLYIKDVATPNDSTIDNYQNIYRQVNVPAPIPILGAGAAFGFSRKLRGRIKASLTA